MHALVAFNTGNPYNRVIRSVRRCDPRRAAAGLILTPSEGYHRWICWRNFVGLDHVGVVMKTNICSLTGVVRDRRCPPVTVTYVRLSNRRTNTAEIVAVQQVGVRILAEGKHQLRRRSTGHIDHRGADTTKIGVAVVETEPIGRRPVVSRLTAPNRSTL